MIIGLFQMDLKRIGKPRIGFEGNDEMKVKDLHSPINHTRGYINEDYFIPITNARM